MEGWTDFLAAQAGAAGVLLGLIFVGLSLNLQRILSLPTLPNRAFMAIALLLAMLVLSSLLLVPWHSPRSGAVVILAAALVLLGGGTFLEMRLVLRSLAAQRLKAMASFVFFEMAALSYVVAGLLLLREEPDGMYWFLAGAMISLVKSVVDSWVLLVEINR